MSLCLMSESHLLILSVVFDYYNPWLAYIDFLQITRQALVCVLYMLSQFLYPPSPPAPLLWLAFIDPSSHSSSVSSSGKSQ